MTVNGNIYVLLAGVITVAFCATLVFAAGPLTDGEPWAIALTCVIGAAMIACVIIIFRQPESSAHLFFKVSRPGGISYSGCCPGRSLLQCR